MKMLRLVCGLHVILFALMICGCDSNDDTNAVDGDLELDGIDQVEDDVEMDSVNTGLIPSVMDGRLYAAAAWRVITPTDENHPCPKYMGGTASNRMAEGTNDDLEARVIVLQQNGVHAVLVSMDLVGWLITDVSRVQDRLEEQGVLRDHVIISSTHTHNAADTIGVWGDGLNQSGRCPEYSAFLVDTVIELVEEAAARMVPVQAKAATIEINETASNFPSLIRDSRIPHVTNTNFVVAQFVDDQQLTVATMINWHSHPEALIEKDIYSADFPRWTRKKVEEELGGTCVYFSGTVGGLLTPIGVDVPLRTEQGEPVLENGQPELVEESIPAKAWSMGYIVGEYALKALAEQAVPLEGELAIDTENVEFPFENIVFVLGFNSGILEAYDGMIKDNPDKCGFYGCMPMTLAHLQLGIFHIVTIPGELFSELSIGREASTYDWSDESEGAYGIKEYPAISGYREKLPQGHLLMEFGLANNEIGYILPESDYTPDSHPSNYEEYFSISKQTAALVQQAIGALLERSYQ